MADTGIPLLPPAEAIGYFRKKGFQTGFAWQDVWQEEHAKAFTVAKAMSRDVLETIRAAVDDALANGKSLAQFQAELTPLLQKMGWWGRQRMIDPATGLAKTVQLGSPRRLKIIYDMNMRMARAAGLWEKIQRTKDALPYLRYTAVMDDRTRPEHAEWHGTILLVDDPWWDTHYPPCGWNCRCTVLQLDAGTILDRGWQIGHNGGPPIDKTYSYSNPRTGQIIQVPAGIDPGFAYNVGKAWLGGMEPAPLLPAELPQLEPGVTPGRVPAGAPAPESMLPETASAADAIDSFLGELDGVGPASSEGAPAPGTTAAMPGSADHVFTDAGGWQIAVGPGLFEDAAGAPAVPVGDRRRVLPLVGRAIARPDEIRWRWVAGADGSKMLFRRYIAKVDGMMIVVDMGKAGWRFATERDPGFDLSRLAVGTVAWTSSQ